MISPPPALQGDERCDVVVVGGGLSGCAAAVELTRRHRSVIVLEAASFGASEPRTGHVPTGLPMPYGVPAEVRDVQRLLWDWTREGHERLQAWLKTVQRDCGYRRGGGFLLALDRSQANALADAEDALREDGYSSEFLDHYMMEARFDIEGVTAGLWMVDDAEVDAAALVRALAVEAAARGARLLEGSRVLRLDASDSGVVAVTPGGRVHASEALVAAGDGTGELLPELDPLWHTLELAGAAHPCGALVPSPARFFANACTWRMVGGRIVATSSQPAESPRMPGQELRDRLLRTCLDIDEPPAQTWRASIGSTKDTLPVIGRLGSRPVAVAAGYGEAALAWAPLAAFWAVEALVGSEDPVPAPLRPTRHAGPAEVV